MFAMMLVQRLAISADISALSVLMNINMASIGYSSFFSVAGIGIAIATFIAEGRSATHWRAIRATL